jgi:release factor glutamine methyltransferase
VSETPPAAAADVWTVRRVLEWTTQHLKTHGSDTPRLDAEILLAHSRGCPRIALYTQFDEPLSDPVRARMRELVQRRAQAEPVAYLVGHREFFSLDFDVTRDVLIPRPDTETLVMAALDAAKPLAEPKILDLCTGSGCVAIAVAKNCPPARVTATDVSAAAIQVATENAAKLQVAGRVHFAVGDLFAAVGPDDRFDIIAANPPYVTTSELESLAQDIRKYEPRSALDGGPDGLDVVRRIIGEAPSHLASGGQIFIEISSEQAAAVQALFAGNSHYADVRALKDLAGRLRVIAARSAIAS